MTETPKKLGIVIQACNLSIWEDEGGGTWVWGLLGLHSDTMSQNNNNYKASKAFMAKDVLGKSSQVQPLETHRDHPTNGLWASGLWGLSSPGLRNQQSKHHSCLQMLQSHSCFTWHVLRQQRHISLFIDTSSLPCKVAIRASRGFLIKQWGFPPKLL